VKSCGRSHAKVSARVHCVVINEFRIRPLCPTPRGRIDLVRKGAHRNRDGDVLAAKKANLFSQESRAEELAVFVNQ
jgi:hypothetical protein